MSLIKNGIFGDPSGSTGGITFGKARTKTGKVATARTKTSPANPNTASQQTQRTIFKEVQSFIRKMGAVVYRVDWNRSIGQLPGFQSMQSLFMGQMDSSFNLDLDTPINLGTLDIPAEFDVTKLSTTSATVGWNGDVTGIGTTADLIKVLFIPKLASVRAVSGSVVTSLTTQRDVEEVVVTGLAASAEYEIYYYAIGAGVASGINSIANFDSVDLT